MKRRKPQRGRNILGPHIRQARLRLSPEMSQADLAAKLSVRGLALDRVTITRIENGKRFLRDFEIRAIARVLRVSVAFLFRESSDPAPHRR